MKMKFYILELFLSGMKLFQNIFRLKFFFGREIYFQISLQSLEKVPKCKISFFHSLSLGRNLFLLKKISTRFGLQFGISSFSQFTKHFFHQIHFPLGMNFKKPTSFQVIHLSLPKPLLMEVSRVASLEVLRQCYNA